MSGEIITKALDDFIIMRKKNIGLINSIDESKVMTIPEAFSNNIYWQAGHLITVQASLLYKRTNQEIPIDKNYFIYFAKGTSPDNFDADIPPFSKLLIQLTQLLDYTSSNCNDLSDASYQEEVTVSTGHKLNSFKDALMFLPLHEAHHLGAMSMLRKLL